MSSVDSDDGDIMAAIEAGLYAAGRPLDLEVISSLAGTRSRSETKRIIKLLKNRYDNFKSALQIVELNDGRYLLQLRSEYITKIRRLVKRKLLSKGPLRTLAFIAYKQPITQAYVTKVRGKLAYQHIRKIVEMGLISEEKLGNTKVLRTTEAFADYFNLSHNLSAMKQQLKYLFSKIDGHLPQSEFAESLYQEQKSP